MRDSSRTTIAASSQIGSVYGISFDNRNGILYASAFAKRHVGYGPLGTGGIYRTDWKTRKTKAWLDLRKLGVETGLDAHQGLSSNVDSASTDPEMMKHVGKVSLGGMDLSANGDTLYVVNLYDRKLYAVHLPVDTTVAVTTSDIRAFQLPSLQMKGGQVRPFAVKYYNGRVFVGAVNDASISQDRRDLFALVYELDPQSGRFKELLREHLDYQRGVVVAGIELKQWNPWTDDFSKALVPEFPSTALHPQPILSSIAFDENGQMVLGFMDRFGHLSGPGFPNPEGTASYSGVAAGDILRVSLSQGQKLRMEKNAVAGEAASEGKNNGQGPSGGEFYFQDGFVTKYDQKYSRVVHEETAMGALVSVPHTRELFVSVHEPEQFNSGGIKSFYSQDGKMARFWHFYQDGQRGTFGKANGIGALALITERKSTFIGNRIWHDSNEDGIQDPDEHGISGVNVELWQNNIQVASTITDVDGHYLFDHSNVMEGVLEGTEYQMRVKRTASISSASAFKAGSDEESDNDAVEIDGYLVATTVTSAESPAGHSVDIGVLPSGPDDDSKTNAVVVYPNPASSYVAVKISDSITPQVVSVKNLLGRTVLSHPVQASKSQKLDLSPLPDGTYVLVLDTAEGKRFSRAIVKIKE
ncbi:SdrD B-like domain-containing protein [Dyadobacter endophyticus]|uniref:SdrD B-like domain-containing protein n=1 Tax=Dyadobacter TaxID=120831 RepID=UPI003CFB9CA6